MAKLVPLNHPALHTIAEEVTKEDFESGLVEKVVKDLRKAIKTYDVDGYTAVAIAAPQIGVSKRIFIIEDQSKDHSCNSKRNREYHQEGLKKIFKQENQN